MTFYWWSHWFWITCLSVQFLPNAIIDVHTYPIQDISLESIAQQDRQADWTEDAGHESDNRQKTSQAWSTAIQRNIMDLTLKTKASAMISPTYTSDIHLGSEDDIEPLLSVSINYDDGGGNGGHTDEYEKEFNDEFSVRLSLSNNQFEFKRSADFASIFPSELLSNFTNFSRSTSTNTKNSSSISTTTTAAANNSNVEISVTADAKLTTTSSTLSPQSNNMVQAVAAIPSTPKINTEWLSGELQKAPFTLENANKKMKLRRTESEHRSRKSKVLSAEYKHFNRYINFSSDTKSLLIRSALGSPTISGYDSDEGNISSEALAIQRTYFLDAGTMLAICFMLFGICCTVGTIVIVLYRRRYLNKPQALSEPDSSIYIDDSTMRDNSDEMYSLDNDSFLNSLEAMTIQNYWTDTVKHTKL